MLKYFFISFFKNVVRNNFGQNNFILLIIEKKTIPMYFSEPNKTVKITF